MKRGRKTPPKSMLWQNPLRFSLIPKNKVFFWKDFGWITHVFINRKNLSWRKRVQYERKTLWSSKWRTGLQGNCSSRGVQLVRWNRDTFWLLWNSRWLCGFIFLTLYIFYFFLESLYGLGSDFGRHLNIVWKKTTVNVTQQLTKSKGLMVNTHHHFHVEGEEWRCGIGSSILVATECTCLKAKSRL